jgi:hypothetical protein
MLGVLLTVAAVWLVLSVLASAACALVARGGLDEDRLRAEILDLADDTSVVPHQR